MPEKEIIKAGPELKFKVFEGSAAEYLIPKLKSHPKENIIQVNGVTGEAQTCYELLHRSLQIAEGLKELGIQQEDVVALVDTYSSNSLSAALGIVFHGAAVFPIDPSLKTLELKHLFQTSEPKLVFCAKKTSKFVFEALKSLHNEAQIILLGDDDDNDDNDNDGKTWDDPYCAFRKFEEILKKVAVDNYKPLPVKNPKEQTVLVVASSGTTGLPKAVAVTHRNLVYQMGLWEFYSPEVKKKMSYLQVTHFFWITGVTALFFSCITGLRRVYMPNVTAENLLNAIDRYKPEWAFMAPIFVTEMIQHPRFHEYDLSSLKLLTVGGSALPRSVADQVKKKWSSLPMFTQLYGMSEITGAATFVCTNGDITSAGIIIPGLEVKVVHTETGKALGPNKQGEMLFRSKDGMMKCYLNNEKATMEAFDESGFYRSGDLGYYTEDGHIFLVGRIKELIKCRGHQVSPSELEDAIMSLSGVKDVAVIGIPHETDHNHPMALVVKKTGSDLTKSAIINYIAENMSETKQLLGGVKFIDAVPRTPNGKIKRVALSEFIGA